MVNFLVSHSQKRGTHFRDAESPRRLHGAQGGLVQFLAFKYAGPSSGKKAQYERWNRMKGDYSKIQ